MGDTLSREMLGLTATIVAAHVRHNEVSAEALPAMIQSVYRSLATIGSSEARPTSVPTPAVPVKRSVFPDFIVCLEDGRTFKTLKRHLKRNYGMTPAVYRARWGLPSDYPMVAPNYAATRASMARSMGLGRKQSAGMSEPGNSQPSEPPVTMVPARRARGSRG